MCSSSPKITESFTVRAGHCLSVPLTNLDKLSLWIFPGWHWEEPRSYTQGRGRVLTPLSSLQRSSASHGPAPAMLFLEPTPPRPSVSAQTSCCSWVHPQPPCLCAARSAGLGSHGGFTWRAQAAGSWEPCRQAGTCPLPCTLHALVRERAHSLTLSLTLAGLSTRLLYILAARPSGSGSKWSELPATLLPSWIFPHCSI